jgi:hypothetical protein
MARDFLEVASELTQNKLRSLAGSVGLEGADVDGLEGGELIAAIVAHVAPKPEDAPAADQAMSVFEVVAPSILEAIEPILEVGRALIGRFGEVDAASSDRVTPNMGPALVALVKAVDGAAAVEDADSEDDAED